MRKSSNSAFGYQIYELGKWKKYDLFGAVIAIAGCTLNFDRFKEYFDVPDKLIDKQLLLKFVESYTGSYGLIIITRTKVLAVTDHIRTFPIYYVVSSNLFAVGNSAEKVRESVSLGEVYPEGVQEYLLSGYVHGDRTLYKSLKVMSAGRVLEYLIEQNTLTVESYFEYFPSEVESSNLEDLIEQFDCSLDQVFSDLSERIRDKPIFVPLSGGLDSRLVLCKLLQHGCERVSTFTYGSRRGHEMKAAKTISASLDVEWISVPSDSHRLQDLYRETTRREYSRYADGLHMTPVLLDFEAIYRLTAKKILAPGNIIINGYSGDFLFGGHIPEDLALSPSVPRLVDRITEKNCANFTSAKMQQTKDRVKADLVKKMDDLTHTDAAPEYYCALYEWWDWSERQTKAVVNGQKAYEFFGLDWALPLWDKRLLRFWSSVPLHFRLNQLLHLRYLQKWNYRNVFAQLRSSNQIWPTEWKWLSSVGSLLEVTSGQRAKDNFYEFMFYHSYFHNQLGMFGRQEYNKWYKVTRRPRVVSLASQSRLQELGIPYEEYLL